MLDEKVGGFIHRCVRKGASMRPPPFRPFSMHVQSSHRLCSRRKNPAFFCEFPLGAFPLRKFLPKSP